MDTYNKRPGLAMVDSNNGITNLHVPSDVIIDASMPNVVRDGGQMWNKDDKLEEVKCVLPDRCYSTMYGAIIEDCKANGQFDYKSTGHVSNVGLMAQKAEEYGSHDKTFEIPAKGTVVVTDEAGNTIFSHSVEAGDIWRMCQTKDAPIKDWVKLAVSRARASGAKAVFWLDPARPHDANLISLAEKYLKEHDTAGLDISFAKPLDAMKIACARARAGQDTITVTGNVLRDYLTDLFPILELGTSAKMLSIVPMLAGGSMYETGAGGSAPKHVQQFQKEGHLRWDSLGEYLSLTCAFEDLASNNAKAKVLAAALDKAVSSFLTANKNPSRKVREIDNRGSHYWVARYWSEELAKQGEDASLQGIFSGVAKELQEQEETILKELVECQGQAVDLGGYYRVDKSKADAAMRPSAALNSIVDRLGVVS